MSEPPKGARRAKLLATMRLMLKHMDPTLDKLYKAAKIAEGFPDQTERLKGDLETLQKFDADLRKMNDRLEATVELLIEYKILPKDYTYTRADYREGVGINVAKVAENLAALRDSFGACKYLNADLERLEKGMRDFMEVANTTRNEIGGIRRQLMELAEALGIEEEVKNG